MNERTLGLAAFALVAALIVAGSLWDTAQAPWHLAPRERPVRMVFAGDIMLDRNVARTAAASGTTPLFEGIQELFKRNDLAVVNFEGTITENPSIAQQDHTILRFTASPALARDALAPLGIDAASLANNHAFDFYESGYESTQSALSAEGIAPFGHPLNRAGNLSAAVEARGKKMCLVGYHELYAADTASVVSEIQALKGSCYRVIVFAHWGIEYETAPSAAQQAEARAFIDAGADLVIGAHPHVVQGMEIYAGKAIFYSLGNFMFDQNFSEEVQRGVVVEAEFYEDKTAFTLTPTTIKQQRAAIAEGADKAATLDRLGGVARVVLP